MGLMFGTIYGCYGLGLWYGVKIIKDEEQEPEFQMCTGMPVPVEGSCLGSNGTISEIQVSASSFKLLSKRILLLEYQVIFIQSMYSVTYLRHRTHKNTVIRLYD